MALQIIGGIAGLLLFIGGLALLTRYLESKRMKDNEP